MATPSAGRATSVALRPRFGATERTLHWIHAAGFTAMLATGLVLYLPALSGLGGRPLVKALHLGSAVAWGLGLALVALLGDHAALRATRRQVERLDGDDLRWLRGSRAPQGRFNAGQKLHTVLQAAFAALLIVSGALLWLGERNTSFQLSGTVPLHDGATFVTVALVLGHLFLALVWRPTRPALRGIVRGSVDAAWANRHHAKWARDDAPGPRRRRPTRRRLGLAAVVALVGLIALGSFVRDAAAAPDESGAALLYPR